MKRASIVDGLDRATPVLVWTAMMTSALGSSDRGSWNSRTLALGSGSIRLIRLSGSVRLLDFGVVLCSRMLSGMSWKIPTLESWKNFSGDRGLIGPVFVSGAGRLSDNEEPSSSILSWKIPTLESCSNFSGDRGVIGAGMGSSQRWPSCKKWVNVFPLVNVDLPLNSVVRLAWCHETSTEAAGVR